MNQGNSPARQSGSRYFTAGGQARSSAHYDLPSDTVDHSGHPQNSQYGFGGETVQRLPAMAQQPPYPTANSSQYSLDNLQPLPLLTSTSPEALYTADTYPTAPYDYSHQPSESTNGVTHQALRPYACDNSEMSSPQFAIPQTPASQYPQQAQYHLIHRQASYPQWSSAYQDTSYAAQPDPQQYSVAPKSARDNFPDYQARVRAIFSHVTEGQLSPAGSLLLTVSNYLLNNIEILGGGEYR